METEVIKEKAKSKEMIISMQTFVCSLNALNQQQEWRAAGNSFPMILLAL